MQTIEFGQQYNFPFVIALGFFDCMHSGHRQLLIRARQLAQQQNCLVAMFTFSNNHFAVMGKEIKLIYTIDERKQIFESLGVNLSVSAVFDKEFMSMTSQKFLDKLFKYDVKGVVCGFDYTCGSDRADSRAVSKFCTDRNTLCSVVQEVSVDGRKVSSTLVRELLTAGQVEKANQLLSQPFFICGKVVHGRGVGHEIGFPTANVVTDSDKLLPEGVYGATVTIGDKQYKAIVNIGGKPTFDIASATIEAHIIDFEGNLYNENIVISLTQYLRGIRRFDSVEQLRQQLNQDILKVKQYDQIRTER